MLRPRLRPGLETDRIAVLYPDRHLDYYADARWSGPLGEVLQDAAVQEFQSRGNLRTVSSEASDGPRIGRPAAGGIPKAASGVSCFGAQPVETGVGRS